MNFFVVFFIKPPLWWRLEPRTTRITAKGCEEKRNEFMIILSRYFQIILLDYPFIYLDIFTDRKFEKYFLLINISKAIDFGVVDAMLPITAKHAGI